jgi:hypothetical protein
MPIKSLPYLALLVALGAPASARPTQVIVRVLAQDAKFVGDHTGGASVTLRDARSGRVLARGKTSGDTGDTERIMKASGRAPIRHSADAASFTAMVDIKRPTLVELEVEGPEGSPQSAVKVTSTRWMMPGEPVVAGDGWLVELPGLIIAPTVTKRQGSIAVEAKVALMCGCPITPGGMWDAADYRVTASAWKGDEELASAELAFSASPGVFRGKLAGQLPVGADFVIFARNVKTGNSGLVRVPR